jgi:general secretion pathway protein D
MLFFNRLTAAAVVVLVLAPALSLQAKTKKGDKFFAQGRLEEAKKNWDGALENYEKALAEDPEEVLYQMGVDKARFHTAEMHVDRGQILRNQGQLGDALVEFQKAYAINPSSAIALQDLQEIQQMILRERKRVEQTGQEAPPEVRALTPGQAAEKAQIDKINRMLPVPTLRQLKPGLLDLKMSGGVKILFQTLGALADPPVNVIWDPDFAPSGRDNFSVDIKSLTLDQALDYLQTLTHIFWKPLSSNTIFVTNDNPTKRRDFEEQVLKTIYLHNVGGTQEFQEVVNAVRTVPELTKVFPDAEQYAIVVKGEADRVALAEKIAHDLDKPRPEVLLDILVMEASSVFSRQITAAIASTGLNVPINFTPRASIQVQNSSTTTTSTTSSTSNTATTNSNTGTTGSSTSGNMIPLSSLGHLSSADFSTTLPSALLQAAMSDAKTRVLQAPELRCIDNVKATLNIGERQPTATGSFQPGIGGVGINPLVNTQFQYIDIGVNIEALARVHSDSEVTISMLLNITSVTGQVNLGGIQQPIIGQRKIQHDLRVREGEVALLGGLVTRQDDKTITGIAGLSSIPFLGNLFKGQNVDHNRDDIVIAVIPHIIRKPEFSEEELRAVAAGTQASIKINYAPEPQETPVAGVSGAPVAAAPPATAPPVGGQTAAVPTAALPATVPPPVGQPAAAPAPTGLPGLPPALAGLGIPTATTGMPPSTSTTSPATAPSTQPAATPAGPAGLTFAPVTVETAAGGGTFTVSLVASNAGALGSSPVLVQFDPKIVRLNDVSAGDLLTRAGAVPLKNIQNDTGSATIQISPGATPGGLQGAGQVLTLTFSAVAAGTTQIVAPNLDPANPGRQGGIPPAVLRVHVK